MPAPGAVVDGNPGYGSIVINLSISGLVLLENINPVRPFTTARDRKVNGEPGRSRYVADFASFTAELQATNSTSGIPCFGETATFTLDDNYGAETWILMPVVTPRSNDPSTLLKLPVTFQKKNCNTLTKVPASTPAD